MFPTFFDLMTQPWRISGIILSRIVADGPKQSLTELLLQRRWTQAKYNRTPKSDVETWGPWNPNARLARGSCLFPNVSPARKDVGMSGGGWRGRACHGHGPRTAACVAPTPGTARAPDRAWRPASGRDQHGQPATRTRHCKSKFPSIVVTRWLWGIKT